MFTIGLFALIDAGLIWLFFHMGSWSLLKNNIADAGNDDWYVEDAMRLLVAIVMINALLIGGLVEQISRLYP